MQNEASLQIIVYIDGESLSERRLNEMTVNLKRELGKLKPTSIELERSDDVPDGVMSVEAITAGAIALAVLPTMVPAIIEYLRDWRLRNADRVVTIKRKVGEEEIEVSFPEDMSSDRLQELIESISKNLPTSDA